MYKQSFSYVGLLGSLFAGYAYTQIKVAESKQVPNLLINVAWLDARNKTNVRGPHDFAITLQAFEDSNPIVIQLLADTIGLTFVNTTETEVTNTESTNANTHIEVNTDVEIEADEINAPIDLNAGSTIIWQSSAEMPDDNLFGSTPFAPEFNYSDDMLDHAIQDKIDEMAQLQAAPMHWSRWMACKGALRSLYALVCAKLAYLRAQSDLCC